MDCGSTIIGYTCKKFLCYKKTKKIKSNIFLVVMLFLFQACQKPTEPISGDFFANAGLNKTTRAGSFTLLDATKSVFPDEVGEKWFEWIQDENNPEKITLFSGNNDLQEVAFRVEGQYKFHLTLKIGDILSTNAETSNTDEVIITVLPRLPGPIEDISLETYIRYSVNEPLNELTDEILSRIDSIQCYSLVAEKIESLNGIEKCINIKYLGASLERIEDLSPLYNLINLEWIDLDQNWKIKDAVALSNLIKLKHLNLDGNYISDISPLIDLKKMTYLNVMYNEDITDISVVHNMTDLEELWLSNSPIKNIEPVRDLLKLKSLWLSKCGITDISSLKNLKELKSLFLKHNSITDISSLAKLTKLERLYLSENNISDISVLENMTNINWFILPDNQIEDITPLVNNLGLGEGDLVDLNRNPLNEISTNSHLKTLRDRGVLVFFN